MIICCVGLLLLASKSWAIDLKYAGATTIQLGFMYDAAREYKKLTGKTISIMGGGSSAGVKGVLLGTIGIGGAGRPVSDKEIKKGIVYATVAWDAIAVIINKKNPVTKLTAEQLKKIHTGDITNWKEVGGPDHDIIIITSHVGSATKKVFQKIVMHKEPYIDSAIIVHSTRDEVDKVLENEFAIGAVSTSFSQNKAIKIVKINDLLPTQENVQAGRYKISRPLNFVTKGKATGEAEDFIAFMLSPTGQKIITKNFIGVSPVTEAPSVITP